MKQSPGELRHIEKFDVGELGVRAGSNWILAVRGKQVTLGSMVILPITPWESFAEIPDLAWSELRSEIALTEKISKEFFSAERVNFVAAMMKDPFVHFHVFPRYSRSIERYGVQWIDEDWPRAVTLRDVSTSDQILRQIAHDIRDDLAVAR